MQACRHTFEMHVNPEFVASFTSLSPKWLGFQNFHCQVFCACAMPQRIMLVFKAFVQWVRPRLCAPFVVVASACELRMALWSRRPASSRIPRSRMFPTPARFWIDNGLNTYSTPKKKVWVMRLLLLFSWSASDSFSNLHIKANHQCKTWFTIVYNACRSLLSLPCWAKDCYEFWAPLAEHQPVRNE